MSPSLAHKLDPARFPNMSLELAAILGVILERQYRPISRVPLDGKVAVLVEKKPAKLPASRDGVNRLDKIIFFLGRLL